MNDAFDTPRWLRIGPIARISLGLVALLVSLVLAADLLLGVVPGQAEQKQAVRQRIAENLALQITALLEVGDTATLGKTIRQVLARDAEIETITVRRIDGSALMQHGQERTPAAKRDVAASTANRLKVPILAGRQVWGEIELRFVPAEPSTLQHWLAQPFVQLMLVLGIGGFGLCYVYLRRAMLTLNPSASVPDRVRSAFDSLSEGLVILDLKGRIVLANRAFRRLHPDADGELTGRAIDTLEWLPRGPADAPPPVWQETLSAGTNVAARPLSLALPDGRQTQLLVSSAAVTDNRGRTRGCLITFDDVTAIHRANDELRSTLTQLETSRRLIEDQNAELRRLASRDAMTGCYNRRAFFEVVETLFATARAGRGPLCCLMVDIDHFKQFNDRYGHAVGDKVIQVVARALGAGLRQPDVLGRYGGEEFCIVLPGIAVADAINLAERIRVDIETAAHRAVRDIELPPITCSFGLATIDDDARTIEALIDQADQALYVSKRSGRNRVTTWVKPAAAAPEGADAAVPAQA